MKRVGVCLITTLVVSFAHATPSNVRQGDTTFDALSQISQTTPVVYIDKDSARLSLARSLSIEPRAKSPIENVRKFCIENEFLFKGANLSNDPAFMRLLKLNNGYVIASQQTLNGIPIKNSELIFRLDEMNTIRTIINKTYDLDLITNISLFQVNKEEAIRKAVATMLNIFPEEVEVTERLMQFTKAVYIIDGDRAVATWVVRVPNFDPHLAKDVLVSAETGEIMGAEQVARFAKAKVWETNPGAKGDKEMIEHDLKYLNSSSEGSQLVGEWMDVNNCLDEGEVIRYGRNSYPICTVKHKAAADANGDYLYEPIMPSTFEEAGFTEDEFAEVHMYYHTNKVYDYYFAFGFDSLNTKPLQAVVNVRLPGIMTGGASNALSPLDNAAFMPSSGMPGGFAEGDAIIFGQGAGVDYSYDADVIYHEFTHAVIGSTSNLTMFVLDDQGTNVEPFSMNEGYADFFSCMLAGDPNIGEYTANNTDLGGMPLENGALRTVDNSLVCAKGMWGEAHNDGKIWSGSLWKIRELYKKEINEDTTTLDQAFYDALVSLSTTATFGEAAEVNLGEIESAVSKEFADEAKTIFEERGILPRCERIIRLPIAIMFVNGRDDGFMIQEVPAPLQFQFTVPEKVKELPPVGIKITFMGVETGYGYGGSHGDLYLIAKRNSPLVFDTQAAGMPSDTEWEKIPLTKVENSMYPGQGVYNYTGYVTNFCFNPGDYYIMLINTNGSEYQIAQVSGSALTELPSEAEELRYNFTGECLPIEEEPDAGNVEEPDTGAGKEDAGAEETSDTGAGKDDASNEKPGEKTVDEEPGTEDDGSGCSC